VIWIYNPDGHLWAHYAERKMPRVISGNFTGITNGLIPSRRCVMQVRVLVSSPGNDALGDYLSQARTHLGI